LRIVSFFADGRESYGAVIDDGIIDAGQRLGARFASFAAVLEAEAFGEFKREVSGKPADCALEDVTLVPPVRGRNPVFCVGRNYAEVNEQAGYPEAAYPSIFQRRHAAQVGHGQPMIKPKVSDMFDTEVELALIIGKRGRHISEGEAIYHVAGYTILCESSVVDWMNHTSRNVTPGKNFDASGAMGPWMVTADEVADPTRLSIIQRINDETVQEGSTSAMIYSIPRLIAYLSSFTELIPGDVISTGTPGGIHARRKQGLFLQAGDAVEAEISGIGVLQNEVVAEA